VDGDRPVTSPVYAKPERRDDGSGGRKLLRYAASVMLGLVAVILLLLAALCVFIGVLVIVDPSYGDPTTVIFIPFGLLFLAAPGLAVAWAAFKTWPKVGR
jgi:hypothetical protein